jgi:alkanesulfonate monooxygenase
MTVEVIGLIHHNASTMLAPRPMSEFDAAHLIHSAEVQEAAGYDRVLIANSAVIPDPHVIATTVMAHTRTLKLMIAHRPGFIAPTVAARLFATLDRVSGGRAGVHVIAGPSDQELAADGDQLPKDERYRRSHEYVGILRRLWTSTEPIDHEGPYYRFRGAFMEVKPVQEGGPPIFWGGSSAAAVEMGARSADIYALAGAPLAATRDVIARVNEVAERVDRSIRFLSTFVVVIGSTEEEAWRRARDVREEYLELRARDAHDWTATKGVNNYQAQAAARRTEPPEGERLDRCFWTGMTEATERRQGNQSTLVGTPEQVIAALMDYHALGVTHFLLRGYRPLEDAREFGKELFPGLRAALGRAGSHSAPE